MNVHFNAFVSSTKLFVTKVFIASAKHIYPPQKLLISRTINVFVFYLEGGLENLQKEQEAGKKFP